MDSRKSYTKKYFLPKIKQGIFLRKSKVYLFGPVLFKRYTGQQNYCFCCFMV